MEQYIHIKGARINNLKNIDLDIPREKLIVVTGLSGSGKSSLAFDTLYAEGQRRYVESLSAYARQFLGRMSKPECDYIKGIPPAIAIEQKVNSRNPRSTVGTSTEIYEYLRLLYARIGRTFSPVSGQEVKKHSTEDIVNCMLSYSPGTRFTVLTPLRIPEGRSVIEQLDMDLKQGFTRLDIKGEMVRIEDYLQQLNGQDPNAEEEWSLEDFTIDGTTITGLSESGMEKLKTDKSMILPDRNAQGEYITEIADTTNGTGLFATEEEKIESVVLPTYLERIGNRAFCNSGLQSVTFPSTTLKEIGFWCVGLDGRAPSTLRETSLPDKIALVMGSEGFGLRRLTAENCDYTVKLPISERVESLNVSNAAAIALYEMSLRKNIK